MSMTSSLPPDQLTNLASRLDTIFYRVEAHERSMTDIKEQFREFSRVREIELQFLSVQSSITRIERDVSETRRENGEIKKELEALKDKIATTDAQSQQRNSGLQLKWLYAIVAGVFAIVLAIIGFVLSRLP